MVPRPCSFYLQKEIIWANQFAECVVYKEEEGIFMVEVDRLNMMVTNYTPRMSAKKMEESTVLISNHSVMGKEDLSCNQ